MTTKVIDGEIETLNDSIQLIAETFYAIVFKGGKNYTIADEDNNVIYAIGSYDLSFPDSFIMNELTIDFRDIYIFIKFNMPKDIFLDWYNQPVETRGELINYFKNFTNK